MKIFGQSEVVSQLDIYNNDFNKANDICSMPVTISASLKIIVSIVTGVRVRVRVGFWVKTGRVMCSELAVGTANVFP